MELKSLEFLLQSEHRSRLYLTQKVWQQKRRFCVRCRNAKIYRLAEKRYRCGRCGYTFQDFSGRWIGRLNLKAKQWLWILKLFELEVPTRRIATEVGISYPTALKVIHLIRCAIVQETSESKAAGDNTSAESYFDCRGKGLRPRQVLGPAPVFGVVERRGQVAVSLIKEMDAETLLNGAANTAAAGPIAMRDRLRGYDALLFCRHGRLHYEFATHLAQGKNVSGAEGFGNFVKERLIKIHGGAKKTFPLYLKELEFRYNHRHDALFDLLATCVTQLMPNPL